MADSPEMPDLKKALENKPAGFAWTPGSTVAKAAASAAGASTRAPSARERLMAQGRGKLVLIAAVLMLGGLVFSFAALRFAGTADGGGGTTLGGVASSMKIRFARQNDPTGYIVRDRATAGEKMRFDLIKGAADKDIAGKAAGGAGAPGENAGGDAPMNYDEGSASRAGSSAGAGGGAAGAGKDGAQGGAGGLSGGGAPRLSASASSIKFQGMRRVSSTAGFRGIQGRRGALNKSMSGGSSATPFGSASGGGAAGGSSVGSGSGSGGAGAGPGRVTPDGAGAGAGSQAGGGGGGGGGIADTGEIDTAGQTSSQIADLLKQAASDRERAEDEKKKAIALKALGQDPQAAYHYDRYRKAKKASEEKEAQANQLTAEMSGAASGITVTPP